MYTTNECKELKNEIKNLTALEIIDRFYFDPQASVLEVEDRTILTFTDFEVSINNYSGDVDISDL
jgi:hypothetical protein